jgi:hypothetical protein
MFQENENQVKIRQSALSHRLLEAVTFLHWAEVRSAAGPIGAHTGPAAGAAALRSIADC